MKTRVLIFDGNETLGVTLNKILDGRGFDVINFSESGVCPLSHTDDHIRKSYSVCSDIIISDLYLPSIDGLKLIKDEIDKGCKVKYRALMSTTWSEAEWQYAHKLGCKLFRKPFDLNSMLEWIDDCAKGIHANRNLINLSRDKI